MLEKENPAIKIKNTIIFINFRLKKLCRLLQVSFSQIEKYLSEKHFDKYQKNGMLFQKINSDVYGKWLAGTLNDFELRAWELALNEWRESWIELLKQYWQENKHSEIQIFEELE